MASSKCARNTETVATEVPYYVKSSRLSAHTRPLEYIPFRTGPSLEHIPNDVLHEILSHLLIVIEDVFPLARLFAELDRTPTLRALSKTSRLLRSRCLGMAGQGIELCKHWVVKDLGFYYKSVSKAFQNIVRGLKACTHLLPLIRSVTVLFSNYQFKRNITAFAAFLATLPNLTTIQVLKSHSKAVNTVRHAFQRKQFKSVRKLCLPSTAHHIIQSCPNVKEVIYTDGTGSTIVGALANCTHKKVQVLRGVHDPLTRLTKFSEYQHLKHLSVTRGGDMTPLKSFPYLETIEILLFWPSSSLSMADNIKEASKILKQSKSAAKKIVIVSIWDEPNFRLTSSEVIRVQP